MTHADWNRALLAEPTDDLARLAFADWLDDRGEAERAGYVRLGVERGRVGWQPYRSAGWAEGVRLNGLVRAAFDRCKPAGWAAVTGVKGEHDRGLAELAPGSPTALARLCKVPWLPGAVAGGWLAPVFVFNYHPGWEKSIAAAWARGLASAVFKVTCFSDPAGVGQLLARPELHGLATAAPDLAPHPAAAPGCAGLRDLSVSLSSSTAEEVAAAVAFARAAPGLRRLSVHGERPAATDADLLALAGAPGLRRLAVHSAAVTPAGVAAARAAHPHLDVVTSAD